MLYLILLLLTAVAFPQKIYVVERERGSLAVIAGDRVIHEIRNLGNLNHATLKFLGDRAYLVSRDGFLSLIDTEMDRLLARRKVGESTIGFTFCDGKVVVANYEPYTVVFLSTDLQPLGRIETGSRNVGVKSYGSKILFSLMDRDEVWLVSCETLTVERTFERVGEMPFDALLSGDRYIVGFFGESAVGILDLSGGRFRKVRFNREGREVVFKIPHFGTWGIYRNVAFIPAVGERKIHVVDLERFEYIRSIDLPGLPVFVAVSPDGRYVAVNFSGDREDYLTLIDRSSGKILRTAKLGRRILHFRFTPDSRFIYLSSYYENRVKKVSLPDLKVTGEMQVPTPSGVFVKEG